MRPSLHVRSRGRRRGLGAAIVEAAIVLPIMATFLGMLTYNYSSLSTRMQADSVARASVADVAAHNCEGGSSAASIMEMGLGVLDQATSSAGSKHGDQGAAQILGNAVKSAGQTILANAVTRYGRRTVTASAKMTCNEKPFNGNIGTWFKYAASAFTGSGGSFP